MSSHVAKRTTVIAVQYHSMGANRIGNEGKPSMQARAGRAAWSIEASPRQADNPTDARQR
jgi:hypothetical protein